MQQFTISHIASIRDMKLLNHVGNSVFLSLDQVFFAIYHDHIRRTSSIKPAGQIGLPENFVGHIIARLLHWQIQRLPQQLPKLDRLSWVVRENYLNKKIDIIKQYTDFFCSTSAPHQEDWNGWPNS